jgi:hypothetical protein
VFRSLFISLSAKCGFKPHRCLLDAIGVIWFIIQSHTLIRFKRGLPDNVLRAKRALFCSSCPIYDAHLKTCGTPGDTFVDRDTNKIEPYGCWCYLPLKNRLHVDCWLWKQTGGTHGWPDELNASFYARPKPKETRTGKL